MVEDLKLPEPLSSISFNKDGFTIACGSMGGKIYVLDLRKLKEGSFKTLDGHSGSPISGLMFQRKSKSSKDKTKANKGSFKSTTSSRSKNNTEEKKPNRSFVETRKASAKIETSSITVTATPAAPKIPPSHTAQPPKRPNPVEIPKKPKSVSKKREDSVPDVNTSYQKRLFNE